MPRVKIREGSLTVGSYQVRVSSGAQKGAVLVEWTKNGNSKQSILLPAEVAIAVQELLPMLED